MDPKPAKKLKNFLENADFETLDSGLWNRIFFSKSKEIALCVGVIPKDGSNEIDFISVMSEKQDLKGLKVRISEIVWNRNDWKKLVLRLNKYNIDWQNFEEVAKFLPKKSKFPTGTFLLI